MNADVKTGTPGNTGQLLPIHAVERETGVSKELLRMWERRYLFPRPSRDTQGDRIYPMDQVNKLRLLRRLIDQGFRPGKIIEKSIDELEVLLNAQQRSAIEVSKELETELTEILKSREPHRIREYLSHQLVKMGLQAFVTDFLEHGNVIVGDAWMRGHIEVHEEHLYTEHVQNLIRQAIGGLRESHIPPHILLTTPPDEQHTLGLLMAESILRLESVDAICYGAQMPVREIVQAVQKNKMNIVALSFSASFPTSRAVEFLDELRFRLPPHIEIWAGGSSLRSTRRHVQGVLFVQEFPMLKQAVTAWRQKHGVNG